MSIVGYARVSTREQDISAQLLELERAGAIKVFADHGISSRIHDRQQWVACMEYLRAGDTLVVRRLDRLAGSEKMAIQVIHDLETKGVHLKSLTEPAIDTTTAMGRALFGIVAVFAQLRVDTIRENTRRGLDVARAQGRYGGRPSVMSSERIEQAQLMRSAGKTYKEIASVLGVGAATVHRALTASTDRHPITN